MAYGRKGGKEGAAEDMGNGKGKGHAHELTQSGAGQQQATLGHIDNTAQ